MESKIERSGEEDVWRLCEQRLSDELPSREYNAWIRPLEAKNEQGQLLLRAPNRYVKEEVEVRYADRIGELVASVDGRGSVRDVRVVVGNWEEAPGGPQRAERHRADSVHGVRHRPGADQSLNGEYVFDAFVEDKSNQIAKAAAMQVAASCSGRKGERVAYNPLLLYGGTGLGKTHLMHAVANQIVKEAPSVHVAYLPAEGFGNDVVRGIRNHTIQQVTERYRQVDVLLIDDIQFFADKGGFQEEFFHVFNAVLERGNQMVLSSDRYPAEIDGLEYRLQSRFVGGLTAEVDMPQVETRVAILQSKGAGAGVHIPTDVAFYIAERIQSNVRELKGALNRVIASTRHRREPVTLTLVQEALGDLLAIQSRRLTIARIQEVVEGYYGVKHDDMISKKRPKTIARPRQLAMTLAKELTSHSLPEIGEKFGGRDHTTVLYACDRIANLRKTDPDVAEDYRNLSRLLRR